MAKGKKMTVYFCQSCGYKAEEKTNGAQNAKKRGTTGRVLVER